MESDGDDDVPLSQRLARRGVNTQQLRDSSKRIAADEPTAVRKPCSKKAKAQEQPKAVAVRRPPKKKAANKKTARCEVLCIPFDYEPVVIAAQCDVSACVSIERVPGLETTEFPSTSDGAAGEIGSGICISASGQVLTAGHVAPHIGCLRVAAFADGVTFSAQCVAVSETWDLALLQLTPKLHNTNTGQRKGKKGKCRKAAQYPHVRLSDTAPAPKDRVVCIGQPGRPRGERLEVVAGRILRIADDPLSDQSQSNDDADGGLVHSCPAFAGNSGSALLAVDTGELVGMHTGYNHKRHTYHGTTWEAIQAFLDDI